MWLKELELIEFQKHSYLKLDFSEGVNMLFGESDAGKSCVRRALSWLLGLESYSEDDIRKEGSKKTTVRGKFDDGLECERTRSASINKYVIRIPNQKELVYDSYGRDLPDEVKDILKIRLINIDEKNQLNLNISSQVVMPFLQDIPASLRLKLFNKMTGNDLLDVVVQNFNKEIIGIRRNLTVEENVIKDNTPKIEVLDKTIKSKKITADFVVEKLKTIGDTHRKVEDLKKLQVAIVAIRMAIKVTKDDVANIKLGDEVKIASLKAQNASLGALSTVKDALSQCKNKLYMTEKELSTMKVPVVDAIAIRKRLDQLTYLKQQAEFLRGNAHNRGAAIFALKELKEVTFDISKCKAGIEKVRSLKLIAELLKEVGTKIKASFGEWNTLQLLIPTQEKEYKAILKEAGVCPTCKAKMTEEHIAHVNL